MGTTVKTINETYKIRGEEVKISAKAKFDLETNEQIFDEGLDDQALTSAFDSYREWHHMITPERIRALRQFFGLSQGDFAALLKWDPTTIAIYETGSLPDAEKNQLLLSLESNPSMAVSLYEDSKINLTAQGREAFEHHTQ
ncbi:transcriptional regulator [Secundilactobacillus folii]|uniref:transcriptional regulator n=1 Tax=Secundilactobacillus folii TaxID=2678357 RepID=UPI001C12A8D0|nr:transcriptional regulator [Secundilactobacillus folii]